MPGNSVKTFYWIITKWLSINLIKKIPSICIFLLFKHVTYLLNFYLVRDIKPRILFTPIFSVNFSQFFEEMKKKIDYPLVQNNKKKLFLGLVKNMVFFFNRSSWWFDVTSKIFRIQCNLLKFPVFFTGFQRSCLR